MDPTGKPTLVEAVMQELELRGVERARFMDKLRAGLPVLGHRIRPPRPSLKRGNKKPRHTKGAGANALHLFSGLFNVARNPVTKRHERTLTPPSRPGQCRAPHRP